MQEIELKFLVPDSRIKGLMRQIQVKAAQTTQMAAHYFDTPDQDLAEAGIGLRIRREGDTWVQTIKAGGDGIAARLEHNTVLDSEQVHAMLEADTLMPDLSLYQDTPIAPALADFKLKKLAKNLTRQYVTDIERTTRLLVDKRKDHDKSDHATSTIEVAYDVGQISHGQDSSRQKVIQEIEFELLGGNIDYLFDIAKVWCKRYKLCLSTVTKAEQGGLLVNEQAFSQAAHASLKALSVDQDSSLPAFVRASVHNCLLQILPNSSAIAAGSTDTDHIEQLRIGLQRLRIALKAFKKFSDTINPDWQPIIKQTAAMLGDYHSLAYIAGHIQPELEALGAPQLDLSADVKTTKVKPIDAVRANDFQLTLLELIAFTMSDVETQSQADQLACDHLPKILSKYHDKLLDHASEPLDTAELSDHDKEDEVSDDAQSVHHLHEQAKLQLQRLQDMRNLSEFAAPLYPKKKTKRWLKRLKKGQKTLSHYVDDWQYYEYYQQKAAQEANALFGAGWFTATLSADDKHYQKRLKKICSTKTFW